MPYTSFRSSPRRLSKSSAPHAAHPARPAVEALEDRSLPSVTMLTQFSGTTSTSFGGAVAFQNHLYFTASLGQSTGLYASDGTAAGTTFVKALSGGHPGANPQFTVVNNTLFFEWDNDLWESDGTAGGTGVLKSGAVGEPGPTYTPLPILNGTLYFLAPDQTQSDEAALWKTDGTAAGTVEVNLTSPLVGKALYDMSDLIAANGKLYFEAQNPDDLNAATAYLWSSDGTAAGTVPLLRGGVTDMTPFDGALYFTTNNYAPSDDQSWVSLYRTDGTTKGTTDLQDFDNQDNATSLTVVNNKLYFFMHNVPIDGISGYPSVLWQTDGTTSGTAYVADFSPPVRDFFDSGTDPILDATAYDGALYFAAWDSTDGTELWKSDGTTGGTALLKDINPGAGGSEPIDGDPGLSSYQLTVSGGKLFFTADDGVHGIEVWETDGTRAGTVMVADINPGAQGSFPQNLTDVNGTLFFTGDDGTHGEQLWSLPAAPPLAATGQMIAAQQGQPFSGEVATFTDPNPQAASAYTATISWGNGRTSAGTVAALANGQFSVSGSNDYAQPGTYTVSVQINRPGGGSVTATTTATVSPVASGQVFETTAGQPFSGVVAIFSDPGPAAASADTATINWGDGHVSAGTITAQGKGLFAVTGTNTYATGPANYPVVVTTSLTGGAKGIAYSAALVSSSASGPPMKATEGQPFSGVAATFTDPSPKAASADTATITWGDGHTSAGTVTALGGGRFAVSGSNTYAHAGSDTVSVQIAPAVGGSMWAAAAITVADVPLWATRTFQHVGQWQPVTGVLGTLTDLNPLAAAGDFTVQIDWGDGSKSAGTLQPAGKGVFDIKGAHVYATAGAETLTVTVTDEGGRTATANPLITVDPGPAPLSGVGQPLATREGQTFSRVVATFTDPSPASAGAYAASISWGDGQASAGTVAALGNGRFAVSGSTTYAHAGTYAVGVQVSRPGGVSVSAAATANVADAPFWATRTFQRVGLGQPVTGVLGTLVDLSPSATAGDFTVVINWGDGTRSPGLVLPKGNGTFDIAGTHDYASAGARTLDVTITDEDGRTITTAPLITVDS